MTVATEVLAVKVFNVSAGTPIPVAYPLYVAEEVFVYYGKNALVAQYNVDYTVALGAAPNFYTFTIVPKASLIAKINALIAADSSEVNFVTIRRVLPMLTPSVPSSVANTAFTSREFDRVTMKLQQLDERIDRTFQLNNANIGDDTPLGLALSSIVPGRFMIWNEDGNGITNSSFDENSLLALLNDAVASTEVPVRYNLTQAASRPVKDGIDKLIVLGPDGGVYTSTANGSSDTFVTPAATGATSRTWYREVDVSRARLTTGVQIAVPVTPEEFGAVADGVTNDVAALTAADNAAFAKGLTLSLRKDSSYLIGSSIAFKSRVEMTGSNIQAADPGDVADMPVVVTFKSNLDSDDSRFSYVDVICADAASFDYRVRIKNGRFRAGGLTIGEATKYTSGHELMGLEFVRDTSRTKDAITLINASDTLIKGMRAEEYRAAVRIAPIKSFAASDIHIEDSIFSQCLIGINAIGTNTARILRPRFENIIISSPVTDAASGNFAGIRGAFLIGAVARELDISGNQPALHLQASLDTIVEESQLRSSASQAIRYSGVQGFTLRKNEIRSRAGLYCVQGVLKANNTISPQNPYDNKDITIEQNKFFADGRGLSLQTTEGLIIRDNEFNSPIALTSAGFIQLNGACIASVYDNAYRAPSGTPVVNSGGTSTITTARPAAALIATTPVAPAIAAPVITAVDAALNNAKSYVCAFTVGDARQIHQLADDDAPKKLSVWMGGVAGATLAWNSSAWTSVGDNVSDIVVDGAAYNNYGVEFHPSARYSAMFIDYNGRLTCREYYQPAYSPHYLLHLGAQSMAERAWITATFRPPIVIDNAIYDAVASGMISEDRYSVQISGRTAIGQKLDGTFVVLVVDGATDISGCTIAQLAAKMLALGCIQAFNLDGGGSTTLWYSGAVINSPTDAGGERSVPAVMYV